MPPTVLHGVRLFRTPLILSHKRKGTKCDPTKDCSFGGYCTDRTKVDNVKRLVRLSESMTPFIANGSFNFNIGHVSGSMVSTGFADEM
jgi:hypothetical protein